VESENSISQPHISVKSGEWLPIFREFGAAEVLGIDNNLPRGFRDTALRINYASTVINHPFVAALFYPPNYRITGLVPLLEQAEVIIYRGCNTDGITACGGPDVLRHFLWRELLEYREEERTNLLVLGKKLTLPRVNLTHEEAEWMAQWAR
jgi:hypothetical protein